MFSVFILARLRLPIPPTPIPAIFSLSLGAVYPCDLPKIELGAIVIPKVVIAALFKKFLLEIDMVIYLLYDIYFRTDYSHG
jgi:hypothetical protein